MGTTGAQFAQHASDVAQRDRQRKEALTDEQRQARENLLADGYQKGQLTPAQAAKGIDDLYAHEPQESRIHRLGRFLSRKPAPAKGPSPKADFQGIVAGEKTPEQLQQEQFETTERQSGQTREADYASYQKMIANAKTPEEKQFIASSFGVKATPKWQAFKMASGQIRYFDVGDPSSIPPDATAVDVKTATKTNKPVLKQINGHDVLWDADKRAIVHDFGVHGSARVTKHEAIQTDVDGTAHVVVLTSVSMPEGGQIEVETEEGGEQTPKPKGKGAAPRSAAPTGDRTLPFQKGTPALNKMTGEYAEAVKLDSIAKQVELNPNDAFNQKRLLVALERTSAGRFTVQALDYIKQIGWGNTVEQWANNPSTGALPKELIRQAVDGAHQNLKAAKDAMDALKTQPGKGPAPKAGGDAASDLSKKLDEAMK